MILQALYDYYLRKSAEPESNIAPEGFEWKEIPFVVIIDRYGNFIAIEDTREGDEKKNKAKLFLVPAAEKKTAAVKANLLWDNIEYALGANPRNRHDIDARKNAFINRLKETFKDETSALLVAPLVVFLQNNPVAQITVKEKELWKEVFDNNANVIFRVSGSKDTTLCETMKPYMLKNYEVSESGICLVSGLYKPIARLNASIKGVRGAQSSGASLVSFNLKAFESYGKTQNYNAPIGEPAAFAYTTVLNMLLGKDSKNKVQAGDATAVFWAQKPTAFEAIFPSFFAFPPKNDSDADLRAVKTLNEVIFSDHQSSDHQTRFYVLGLAPNVARISVRFWHEGNILDFAKKIQQHYNDIEIIRSKWDTGHYALFWILSAIAQENKVDNLPPNLAGQIVQAVMSGLPYPVTMLQQTMRRIRATQNVTRVQAGILKAYLNRYYRIHITKEKEITVALDTTNNNPGYRLGRLFAVLEKIQEKAIPGLNATIRDRFYGAASSSPATVFPQLLKLKSHHLSKSGNIGRTINFEHMLAEIFDGIGHEMPSHLAMADQSRFAIGYYHQRQALFSDFSNDENKKEE